MTNLAQEQARATIHPHWSRFSRFIRQHGIDYVFVAPYLLHFFAFVIFPLAFCIGLSFTNYNMYLPTRDFIGLGNYEELLKDHVFIKSLANTAYYVIFTVVCYTVLGFLMAVLLNQKLKGNKFFRTLFYFPVVVDWVIISIVWRFMLEPAIGLVNQFLTAQGLSAQPFFNSPQQAMPIIIIMSIWKSVAYYAIIYLAGLQDVPQVLVEQAQIDGANTWQVLRHITLPWLAPVTLFLIIIASINSLRVFTQVYVLTAGGPLNSTITMMLYLYNVSFRYLRMGYGSAVAVIFSLAVLVLVIIQRRVLGSGSGGGAAA